MTFVRVLFAMAIGAAIAVFVFSPEIVGYYRAVNLADDAIATAEKAIEELGKCRSNP